MGTAGVTTATVKQDHQKLKVAAVIVTYNRKALLRQCLEAIHAQTRPPDETIVVDNASTDGTREMLRQEFPWVTHIYSSENTGPSGGFAQGLRAAYDRDHDLFWCFDDDCWPMGNEALATLLAYSTRANAHMVLPLMCDRNRHEFRKAAMWSGGLMHREVVEMAGLPNPALFMGQEEIDYFERIAPHKPVIVRTTESRCFVWHAFGPRRTLSMRLCGYRSAEPAWRKYYQVRNHLYVDLRSRSLWRVLRRIMVTAGMLACSALEEHPLLRIRYILKGLWDGIWGRMGRRVEPGY